MRIFFLAFLLAKLGTAMEVDEPKIVKTDKSKNHKISFKNVEKLEGEKEPPYAVYESADEEGIPLNLSLALDIENFYFVNTTSTRHELLRANTDTDKSKIPFDIEISFVTEITEIEKGLFINGENESFWENFDKADITNDKKKEIGGRVLSLGYWYLIIGNKIVELRDHNGQILLSFAVPKIPGSPEITIFSNGNFALLYDMGDFNKRLFFGEKQLSGKNKKYLESMYDALLYNDFSALTGKKFPWAVFQFLYSQPNDKKKDTMISRDTRTSIYECLIKKYKSEKRSESEILKERDTVVFQYNILKKRNEKSVSPQAIGKFKGYILYYIKDRALTWGEEIWTRVNSDKFFEHVRDKFPEYPDCEVCERDVTIDINETLFKVIKTRNVAKIGKAIKGIDLLKVRNSQLKSPSQYASSLGEEILAHALIDPVYWYAFFGPKPRKSKANKKSKKANEKLIEPIVHDKKMRVAYEDPWSEIPGASTDNNEIIDKEPNDKLKIGDTPLKLNIDLIVNPKKKTDKNKPENNSSRNSFTNSSSSTSSLIILNPQSKNADSTNNSNNSNENFENVLIKFNEKAKNKNGSNTTIKRGKTIRNKQRNKLIFYDPKKDENS